MRMSIPGSFVYGVQGGGLSLVLTEIARNCGPIVEESFFQRLYEPVGMREDTSDQK